MVVSAHQPQYLPWIGYFHKIAHCDAFVVLDNVQYKKREYQNRNKIRTSGLPLWLTVPVVTKGQREQVIQDVKIEAGCSWAEDHWKSLRQHYGRALFFQDHAPFIESLYGKSWDRLMDVNMEIISYLLRCFSIPTVIYFESALKIEGEKTDRLVAICRKLGAREYLSGAGGKDYLEEDKFKKADIRLTYQSFTHPVYPQVYPGFESHLSAVDLLLNCGPESRRYVSGDQPPISAFPHKGGREIKIPSPPVGEGWGEGG